MAKAVRLADIAKILNVSTVTVSKALSDQKGVSEEMNFKRIAALIHPLEISNQVFDAGDKSCVLCSFFDITQKRNRIGECCKSFRREDFVHDE